MNRQQQQVMDSLVRVSSFIEAHPPIGTVAYATSRDMLEQVVQRLREHASAQRVGLDLSRAEVRRQSDQISLLFDQFIRPIVEIAKSQIEPRSDVGLPAGLRMPQASKGPTQVLAACDGMIEAARPFEALLIANGCPADFLAQFTAARNTLAQLMRDRATHVVRHTMARAGLRTELVRGRRAVGRLDALVRASFRGDATKLAAWRMAKRVHLQSGGAGARGAEPAAPVASGPTPPEAPALELDRAA